MRGDRILSNQKMKRIATNSINNDMFANFDVDLNISDINYMKAIGHRNESIALSSKVSERIMLLTDCVTYSPTMHKNKPKDFSPASN
jgi:hypothetical protein